MSEAPLSERQTKLLAIVAGAAGTDARRIDLTAGARYGPAQEPSCGNSKNSSRWGWSSGMTAGQVPGTGGR